MKISKDKFTNRRKCKYDHHDAVRYRDRIQELAAESDYWKQQYIRHKEQTDYLFNEARKYIDKEKCGTMYSRFDLATIAINIRSDVIVDRILANHPRSGWFCEHNPSTLGLVVEKLGKRLNKYEAGYQFIFNFLVRLLGVWVLKFRKY